MGGHEVVVDRLADCCDGLSWSPDSKFLVYHDKENPQDPVSVFMLDRDTLQRRRLTTPPKGTSQFLGDVNPVFNGDGSRIAFWRTPIVGINEIVVLNLHTGTGQTIVHESSSPPGLSALAWDVTGKSLIYVSDRTGIRRLWRVAENGGAPEEVNVGEDASSVAISERGHRLAFTRAVQDSNIWKISIDDSGTERRTPLIASSRLDHQAMFSPDETKIVFNSDRSGFEEIWLAKSDGSDPVQLTHLNTHATGSPMWSPDSQRIAFDARTAGEGDIYVVGLDGAIPKRITVDGFDNTSPVWSADGKWIYYTTDRLGERQIFRIPVGGGAPSQVTLHGGNWPLNVDDKRMYYLKARAYIGQVWQKSLPDGEESRVAGVPEIPSLMIVQVTDAGVYFTSGAYSGHLRFADFSTKQLRELSRLGSALDRGLSVSKDGRSILYSQRDSASSNIMVVENFRRRTWSDLLHNLVHSALRRN
jgi:Tol biopolymer transport system component